MNEQVKAGSRWSGGEDCFQVIALVEADDNTWVHYRRERDGLEFSCWLESFELRFQSTPHTIASTHRFGQGFGS